MKIRSSAVLQLGSKIYYKDKPVEFIRDWLVTYDPRNSATTDKPTLMPFVLFPRQEDLVYFLLDCMNSKENGLIEKARDMGATWVNCAFSVWCFLFMEGSSIGWGSRKEQLVDKIGDPDSIFEKIRMMLANLPPWFLPEGWNPNIHCSYMKIRNPVNGATITGEAGDNIGRGGRKSIYFKDESAHYERPEMIEAALGDNTDVQIDFSSVNGPGNVFHRRRLSGEIWERGKTFERGKVRIFIMDWRDHPNKDQGWYNARKKRAEDEGLINLFYQEVDRDYNSAVANVVIPGNWVRAAIDLHKKINEEPSGLRYGALDPYDEAGDAHAMIIRKGYMIEHAEQWAEGDVGDAARKSIMEFLARGVNSFQYDGIGVGSGVKSECNRLISEKLIPLGFHIQPWIASAGVKYPNQRIFEELFEVDYLSQNPADRNGTNKSLKNKDFYKNLKAQGWWELRLRFERTYKFVNKGEYFDYDELISIPSELPCCQQLVNELSQATYTRDSAGKIIINKKPAGTRSPNLADDCVMAFWPADPTSNEVIVGGPAGIGNPNRIVTV